MARRLHQNCLAQMFHQAVTMKNSLWSSIHFLFKMAEAHSAVAFSFTITHEGVNINYDHDIFYAVWQSGLRSWRRRLNKFWNNVWTGAYPASPYSLLIIATIITFLTWKERDVSHGLVNFLESHFIDNPLFSTFSIATFYICYTIALWLIFVNIVRYFVKILFMYKGWMYQTRAGKMSWKTKCWLAIVSIIAKRKPQLYSFQGSLPNLPVPALDKTMKRYLETVKPLLDEEKFKRMEVLAQEFGSGIGKKLQRYLVLKSWWATNYVSDWWEEFIYLRGRGPLMINSNFYGIDAILVHPSKVQAARAACFIHSAFLFRRSIDRQTLKPIMVQNLVPLCSAQYERMFNTTRVPGKETDKLVHLDDSQHVAVYHAGRFFKVPMYYMGRLLNPAEIQRQIEKILNDESPPQPGEEHLGALTAVERNVWAEAREKYFAKGLNKASLSTIEKAAFFVSLDEESYDFDAKDRSKLDEFGRAMLHGKGYDRWFDKSFNFIIAKNGRVGLNAEHSWADAPIMGHLWEFCLCQEFNSNPYTEEGNCIGEIKNNIFPPSRLKWDFSSEIVELIDNCRESAQRAINDVDLRLLMHDAYGKGFMKKCRVSPDAYIQMALQLAYYRDSRKFSLTYEASMTRLFREGRTETVRPVTMESCEFVKSMLDSKATNEKRIELLRKACDRHQRGYQNAMCGKGIDRHLFCLYVVAKYLNVESPFLNEVLSEPWRLSTSQTPHGQTDMMNLKKNPHHISAGGGFGPVADDGYGVSYIIAGEDIVFFHISSKISSPETDSERFRRNIAEALADMRNIFEQTSK
ncbi:carnitine O-palmitoyltransferase 1, liver isoform-like isoform X1 [Argiope bruennichi]|uniref:carnitine O-palmitoyltransferase 1, liver isoform-like isoform X1 n=2 Tax=Argiope bruennichi TaxID=94029 RepID=UPI0024940FBE|nr:carnitine O-palmitoyltransferase 1, liver isoform-like isoform X1 [Argiope bruennichi]